MATLAVVLCRRRRLAPTAATHLKKNAVKTKNIKNKAVNRASPWR